MKNQTKESYDELERRRNARNRKKQKKVEQEKKDRRYIVFMGLLLAAVMIGIAWWMGWLINEKQVVLKEIQMPGWVEEDFLNPNPYSRPQTKMKRVNGIVIHYVANPGTSAKQNRNYFNGLKDQKRDKKISASSHFIIGLKGEVIQDIPIYEVAYATSKKKNVDTISIECCHPDQTGKFNQDTYDSAVKLTAWLCNQLGLTEKDVIRHYDATGKDCPRYFVAHEDAWKQFLKDVKKERKQLE